MSASSSHLTFPRAQQAQIIRANQRDLFHVSSLKEQAESVLRAWLGTRRVQRLDKELDVFVKLLYFGLTTGRATQTLGEEYTDIWQYDSRSGSLPPRLSWRLSFIFLSICPPYLLAKLGNDRTFVARKPELASCIKNVASILRIASEVNLAIFYLKGSYYDPIKRLLGVQNLSSFPENPHSKPPSYAILGVMIGVRLIYRLVQSLKSQESQSRDVSVTLEAEGAYLDDKSIESVIAMQGVEDESVKRAEDDEGTALDVERIPPQLRQSRNCALCLEERTDSCVTECGHLFCWNCIVGWGREKPECPLCRQALSLAKLLPIHNL
ncbi:peroxisome assembly protein per8 [Coprinopsis marcescibilis]|uniref:RING-type E3 ubiquitin transferase n=1 Tax=Coprinopsis marcescibilis TaxID=230819 RepID=A0A5C3LDG0_COPMA|nr:peroxisome assembly protein per8 [Coprinopsis marcescibilis]